MPLTMRRGLYLLTRDGLDDDALLGGVREALEGGAVAVQYRDKAATTRPMAVLRALVALCDEHDAPLIVNDDPALAKAIGAHGVHLGEHDGTVAEARALLGPDALIGVSCYDDAALALKGTIAGADYLAFGSFFPSGTKPSARRAHPQLLRDARGLGHRLVAIGGITPDNAAPLLEAGADLVAVIGAIWDAEDKRSTARVFASLFQA